MHEVKWLLVDLDNTLLDFDLSSHTALQATFEHFDLPDRLSAIDTYHRINHQCWDSFEKGKLDISQLKKLRFDLFAEEMQLDFSGQKINRFYLNLLAQQVHEIEGARTFLDWATPRFNLILATNGFAEIQYPRLKHSGLNSYFQEVVISEEIGVQKPHRAFYDHAFELMNYPSKSEVMIIGDSLSSDIQGGLDYKIRTCWFDRKKVGNATDLSPSYVVDHLDKIQSIFSH